VTIAHTAMRRAAPPWRLLLRCPTFLTGAAILLFSIVCGLASLVVAVNLVTDSIEQVLSS
jgi:hypothetical protein